MEFQYLKHLCRALLRGSGTRCECARAAGSDFCLRHKRWGVEEVSGDTAGRTHIEWVAAHEATDLTWYPGIALPRVCRLAWNAARVVEDLRCVAGVWRRGTYVRCDRRLPARWDVDPGDETLHFCAGCRRTYDHEVVPYDPEQARRLNRRCAARTSGGRFTRCTRRVDGETDFCSQHSKVKFPLRHDAVNQLHVFRRYKTPTQCSARIRVSGFRR